MASGGYLGTITIVRCGATAQRLRETISLYNINENKNDDFDTISKPNILPKLSVIDSESS